MAPKSRAPRKTSPSKPRAASSRSHDVETALAAFAHEVRTPLTGILAISDLLATAGLPERERRWAETIKTSAEHLAALATLFVDAARSGSGELRTREDFFDLRALAHQVADAMVGRATAKGLQTAVTIADTLPTHVVGDPVLLRAALENLIDNAVKFTAHGRVALKVSAGRATKGRIKVSFAVADSGIGLTETEIKRLFRPFSQASAAIAKRFGGAGLGLASVRRLARTMGGDVTAIPRRNGATFILTVLLAPAPLRAEAASDASPTAHRSLHLLGVEDNPFGRVVLNTILTELGHRIEFIGRGEEACERLLQTPYDAVLMDLVLPGIGGLEAIRRIRALPPPHGRTPIIAVSGRSEDARKARRAGAEDFVVKPMSPRSLATALLAVSRHAADAP
jgi:CheY-like chemotaxis protein/nitrogen-specific signal transduction histidine kinase